MKKKLLAAAVACLLGASAQAQTSFVCGAGVPCSFFGLYNSATDGPVANGMNNLVVNGAVYNVTFSSSMNSPFTTVAAGEAAADAITHFFGAQPKQSDTPGDFGYIETEFGGTYNTVLAVPFFGAGPNYNGAVLSGTDDYPTACGTVICTSWMKVSSSSTLLNGTFVPAKAGCQLATTSIPNWTIANNVDVVEANCNVGIAGPNGSQYYIDLTGSNAEKGVNDVGAISQVISTIVGKTYTLSFYFGGNALWKLNNPGPNDGEYKAMEVSINNNVQGVFGVHTASVPYYNSQWQKETVTFTATTPFTSISFQSLNGSINPSDYGPLLADITLTHN